MREGKEGTMTRKVLEVNGMSCAHCKAAVEEAVGAVDGVEKVDADFRKNRVTVKLREEPGTLEKVKAAIAEAGYTVVA